ncbi:E3 ubiquitin-protein ligase DTX3L-like [Bombina bombina]|uniref:E3 ubiquitin-protein ligase DTX3L-like n=1 Tax=Bombina bombina TaxID=8345 RepID=UPI00235B1A93|nr:E3 ubiquitin-protein ligase DTX3L-like [Bombina bombina]
MKIIYDVPGGIQRVGHPHPGSVYQGGRFEAYLPDIPEARNLLSPLEKALKHGLTFKIQEKDPVDCVTWNCIPHKTSLNGGRQKNGFPDSIYLKNLKMVLKQYGIE